MLVLHQSPWYQQIISEGRKIERQEAMERERLAAKRHVLQILGHRFGDMPPEVTASLQTLDTAALETLLGVALSVANLQEFKEHPLLA